MNKIIKPIVAIFVGLLLMAGSVVAQTGRGVQVPVANDPVMESPVPVLPFHAEMSAMNFEANTVCYVPAMKAFVVIDSIDCAVDFLVREGSELRRIGRFTNDVYQGRHDLVNILRPKSVAVWGDKILVLASSKKDSSYLAVVGMEPTLCKDEIGFDTLKAVSCMGLESNAFAFRVDPVENEIIVVGKNPVGYDLHFINCAEGLDNLKKDYTFHYHVPKQSERIKASDPHGGGLALVAISVVFFALVCVCFIMSGYGKLIQRIQNRKAPQAASAGGVAVAQTNTGEVYAAIAAAIYAYSQDLHDVEDTVITIQKVERAWTPWNAKFYNMNKYFSERPNMLHKKK